MRSATEEIPIRQCDIVYDNNTQLYSCICRFVIRHDDVIKWKPFPRYWPFVRGIHRSRMKGQWRLAFMFSLICVWIKGWVHYREAGDWRRYYAHYDVIVTDYTCATTFIHRGRVTYIYVIRLNYIFCASPISEKRFAYYNWFIENKFECKPNIFFYFNTFYSVTSKMAVVLTRLLLYAPYDFMFNLDALVIIRYDNFRCVSYNNTRCISTIRHLSWKYLYYIWGSPITSRSRNGIR